MACVNPHPSVRCHLTRMNIIGTRRSSLYHTAVTTHRVRRSSPSCGAPAVSISRFTALIACALFALAGCENNSSSDNPPAVTNPEIGQHGYELELPGGGSVKYLLFLPAEYEQAADWPLMLFLHGSGEAGDDLNLVKRQGPPYIVEQNPHFPFVVLSPQNPVDDWWSTDVLDALLNDIVSRYHIDRNRICVTGLSLGGYGAWSMAIVYPDRFAAIAPVSGAGNPSDACRAGSTPVWAFHGADDPVVPVADAEAMVNALLACGGNARLTIYPNTGHAAWYLAYDDSTLYDWLLANRLDAR